MPRTSTWTAIRSAGRRGYCGAVADGARGVAARSHHRVARVDPRAAALGDAIATSVLEARAGEVIVGDSTSVNLYKARPRRSPPSPGRKTLVTSDDNFPTDLYVLQSLAARPWPEAQGAARRPGARARHGGPAERVDKDTALVCLSHVAYRSGALLDMAEVTRSRMRPGP